MGRRAASDRQDHGGAGLCHGVPVIPGLLCFNRAVELIGANRASVYFYLIPLIGVALTVLIFHEPLHGYHAAGALLIVAGILISSLRRPVTRGAARDAGA